MKTYFGLRRNEGTCVMVSNAESADLNTTSLVLNIEPSRKLNNMSMSFDWGYGGSGPAQLALAILLDYTDKHTAETMYENFKWDLVSGWDDGWRITGKDIDAWLLQKRQAVKGFTGSHTGAPPSPLGGPGAGTPPSIQG